MVYVAPSPAQHPIENDLRVGESVICLYSFHLAIHVISNSSEHAWSTLLPWPAQPLLLIPAGRTFLLRNVHKLKYLLGPPAAGGCAQGFGAPGKDVLGLEHPLALAAP